MKIIETNMSDGVDIIWDFNTIQEALESERFDYLSQFIDEDSELSELDVILSKSETIEEFINNVGYPFYTYK